MCPVLGRKVGWYGTVGTGGHRATPGLSGVVVV